MIVTAILALEFIICGGWISPSNAQPSASLLPQEHQSVCRGESISYNCIGSGTVMDLYGPPIVNESRPLVIVPSDPVLSCDVRRESAAAIVFGESGGGSVFMGTITFFISDEQSEGERRVSCAVSASDGRNVTNSSTFSVLGAPSAEAVNNIELSDPEIAPLSYNDDVAQVTVNLSLSSPVNVQEFELRVRNTTGYVNAVRFLENRVTVLLPYGEYLAFLCVKNRCGKVCKDDPKRLLVKRQSDCIQSQSGSGVGMDPALLAAAIIAGVLGVFLIVAVIYGVVFNVKWVTRSK